MFVCVYIYVCVCVYICVYACKYVIYGGVRVHALYMGVWVYMCYVWVTHIWYSHVDERLDRVSKECVCVRVFFMYVRVYVCVYVHIYIYIYIYIWKIGCDSVCIYIYMYIHTHTYIWCIYIHTYIWEETLVQEYVDLGPAIAHCQLSYIHMHAHVYIYVYTCKHTCNQDRQTDRHVCIRGSRVDIAYTWFPHKYADFRACCRSSQAAWTWWIFGGQYESSSSCGDRRWYTVHYIYIYIYTWTYIHRRTSMRGVCLSYVTSVYVYTMYIHVCALYICMHTYIHTYIHMKILCECVYENNIYIYIHVYTFGACK